MTGEITYDGNNLQDYDPTTSVGIITNSIEHTDIPNKDITFYQLAHANSSTIPFINYPSKKVTIAGVVKGDDDDDLDERIDTFKGYFNGKDKNLDVEYAGSTRRYIATVNALSVKRHQKALYAEYAAEFICTQPFGRDTTPTVALSDTGRTDASYSDMYTFLGNAPYQLPIVTITLTDLTGGTDASIQWGNGNNGQAIFVQRTWEVDDVLIIDCTEGSVKVNGVPVDFSGAFPEFPPGVQVMEYIDTLTTREFDIAVEYEKGYM